MVVRSSSSKPTTSQNAQESPSSTPTCLQSYLCVVIFVCEVLHKKRFGKVTHIIKILGAALQRQPARRSVRRRRRRRRGLLCCFDVLLHAKSLFFCAAACSVFSIFSCNVWVGCACKQVWWCWWWWCTSTNSVHKKMSRVLTNFYLKCGAPAAR